MSVSEVVVFLVAMAFVVISAVRNVAKQQQQEQKYAQQEAEEAHRPAPHVPKLAVKKKLSKERPFFEELKAEKQPVRVQKKIRLPGGSSLRAAILSKEILDPPVGLR